MTPDTPVRSAFTQALGLGMDALTKGRLGEAGEQALRAVHLDPQSEEAWLLLAAAVPPQDRAPFLQHVLQLHPESGSARQALAELAHERQGVPAAGGGTSLPSLEEILAGLAAAEQKTAPRKTAAAKSATAKAERKNRLGGKGLRWAAALLSVSCLLALSVTAFAGVVTYAHPREQRDPSDVHTVVHAVDHRILHAHLHFHLHSHADLHGNQYPAAHQHADPGRLHHSRGGRRALD
jgi:hypothetical protein